VTGLASSVSVMVSILGGESKGEGAGVMVSSSEDGEMCVVTVSRANVDWEFLLDFLLSLYHKLVASSTFPNSHTQGRREKAKRDLRVHNSSNKCRSLTLLPPPINVLHNLTNQIKMASPTTTPTPTSTSTSPPAYLHLSRLLQTRPRQSKPKPNKPFPIRINSVIGESKEQED